MVSFGALRERNVLVSNVNGVIVGMAMFLLFTILIILGEYPSPGFGLSEFDAGLVLVPAVASMLVAGPFLGRAISSYGPRPIMVLGFVLIIAGALGLVELNRTTYEVGALGIPLMVGNVAVLISMTNAIVLSVDPRTLGIQTGMNQTFRNLGSALGPVLVTSILAGYAFNEQLAPGFVFQNYHVLGYQVVFGLVGAIGIIGLVVSLALRNYRFLADGTRTGHPSGAPVSEPAGEKQQQKKEEEAPVVRELKKS